MIDKKNAKFFIHGKFFDDQDEFIKYLEDWPELRVDLPEFKRMLDMRFHEVAMNDQMQKNGISNIWAYRLLRVSTDWAEPKDE